MEKGHYDVSVAVFEHDLGPAVRAHPDAVVLADGFSCRTQLADLEGRESLHLAQLLASRLDLVGTGAVSRGDENPTAPRPRLTSGFSLGRVRRLEESGARSGGSPAF